MRRGLALGVAALGLAGCVAPASAMDTHCVPPEKVVFACATGKKLLSVCGVEDGAGAFRTLQYRFGPLGAPEMVWPPDATSRQGITAGTTMYSGGGLDYIRFDNAGTRYVVYTGIGRGWFQEGVAVERNGKVIANLLCQDVAEGHLMVPGLPKDTERFERP